MSSFCYKTRSYFWVVASLMVACGVNTQPSTGDVVNIGGNLPKNTLTGAVELADLGVCFGVSVLLKGPAAVVTLTTEVDGTFKAEQLAAGAYQVTINQAGYQPVEEVIIFDGQTALDVGVFQLNVESVPVVGQVELSDGENPAGTAVSVTGQSQRSVPDGLTCNNQPTDTLVSLFSETAIVNADGGYQVNVPRRGQNVHATIERPSYTREQIPVAAGDLQTASAAAPVNLGTRVLYPLTGFINIVGGSIQASDQVKLQISAFNGAGEMAIGVETDATMGYCDYQAWQSYRAESVVDVLVGKPDGAYNLCVKVRNAQRQEIILKVNVLLDTTPPSAPVLLIGSGSPYVTSQIQNIQIFAADGGSGLDKLRLFEGSGALILQTDYSPSVLRSLNLGANTITAVVSDKAGNWSPAGAAEVVFDNIPPAPGVPALTLNAGNSLTNDPIVTAALSASGADEYQLSQDSGFAGAAWLPMTQTTGFLLSGGDGLKTVYVRFRDAAGNTSAGNSAQITLDQQAPVGISISGAAATNTTSVNVTLTGNDVNGLWFRLSELPDFSDTNWCSMQAVTQFTLSSGDGLKVIYAQFRDGANNLSQVLLHGVNVDTLAPQNPSLIISESPYSQSQNLTLLLNASGADQVRLSESPSFAGADWQSYGLLKTFALTAGEGLRTVWAQYRDNAGNLSVAVSATTTLDTINPGAPMVVVNQGDLQTNNRLVNVSLTFVSGDEVEMQLSESSSFAGVSWVSITTATTFQLSVGDATKTLFVRVRDRSGRISLAGQDDIVLDTTGPATPTIQIDGGQAYSNDLNVDLLLGNQVADAVEMIIGDDVGFIGKSWQPIVAATTYTLPNGDGVKTIYVKYRDTAGNESAAAAASIVLDTQLPGSPQISISAGAAYTKVATVPLSLFSDGAVQMRLSQNANFAGSTWIAYSTSYSFPISTGEGLVVIYAQFRDEALNSAGPVSDSILYDGTPPTSGFGIRINNNSAYTTSRHVSVALDVPLDDASEMIIANNIGFAGVSWQSATNTVNWDLSSGDGSKIVYAKWRDLAGNETAIQSDDIELDTIAPSLGNPAIAIAGGAVYSNQAVSVAVNLSASDGAYWLEIDDDQGFTSPLVNAAYSGIKWAAVPSSDGVYTLYVRFRDEAGNWSETRSDSIVLDRTLPTLSGATVNQGSSYTRVRGMAIQLSAYDDNPLNQVEVSENGFMTSQLLPYQPQFTYNLQAAEGVATNISLRVRDAAGNWSAAVTSQAVTLDQTPPTAGTVPLKINNGQSLTNSVFAQLTIDYGNADEMRLSNNGGFFGSAWQPVTSSLGWLLSGGDGIKDVFIQFRDLAKNETNPPYKASITLDTQAPLGASFDINENAVTSATTWTVNINPGNANYIYLAEDAGFNTGVVFGALTVTEYSLISQINGSRTLYAKFCDLAGNCTALQQQSKFLDTQAPQVGSLQINSGAAKTADPAGNVTLNLFAADTTGGSGIVGVRLGNTLTAAQAAMPQPYEQTKAWSLAPPHGIGTDAIKTVYAIYNDAADNRATAVTATIRFDRLAPTGSINFDRSITNDSLALVNLSYVADTSQMKLSYGNACAGGSWVSVANQALWPLSLISGQQYISVQYRDDLNNESLCYSASITRDTEGPTPTMFTVANAAGGSDSGYSNQITLSVNAAAAGGDCLRAEIAEDIGFIAPQAYLSCSVFPVNDYNIKSTTDGVINFYIRYFDNLGNVGPVSHTTIILDRQEPQIPFYGAFQIVEGDHVNYTNITLQLNAIGADQVAIAEGTACDDNYQAFTPIRAFELSAGDAVKAIAVRYRDYANNLSACFSRQITLDTHIGLGWMSSLMGLEGLTYLTGHVPVTVTIQGQDADVVQMKVSNLATFADANWEPFQPSSDWILPVGDGLKSVYIKIRDRAGNESSQVAYISLDQTPPDPPALQVFDTNNDGFAYTAEYIELQWSLPTGAEKFELQRLVGGVNNEFVHVGFFHYPQATYVDPVSHPGRTHQYRMRAWDAVNNRSSWSIVATAQPYEPLTTITWIRDYDQYRFNMTPNTGTFSLQPTYWYEDFLENVTLTQLVANITTWVRNSIQASYEKLIVRTANQNSSLVYDSEFPLPFNRREAATLENSGRAFSLVVDERDGEIAHLFAPFGGMLSYLNNQNVSWSYPQIVDPTSVLYYGVAADQDRWGDLHVAYWSGWDEELRYATTKQYLLRDNFESGDLAQWQNPSAGVVASLGGNNEPSGIYSLMLFGDRSIESAPLTDANNMRIRFWYQRGGVTDDIPDVGAFLRVDALDGNLQWHEIWSQQGNGLRDSYFIHVAIDVPTGTQRLRIVADGLSMTEDYWFIDDVKIEARGSSWTISTLDDHNGLTESPGRFPSMEIAPDGIVHISYNEYSNGELRYVNDATTDWFMQTIVVCGCTQEFPSRIRLDGSGEPHIAYSYFELGSYRLKYARRSLGLWSTETVVSPAYFSYRVGFAISPTGESQIVYTASPGAVKLVTGHFGLWNPPQTLYSASVIYDPDIDIDENGNSHVSFGSGDYTDANLFYATNANTFWEVPHIDLIGNVGTSSQIVATRSGRAHFAYWDQTNQRVKWAVYGPNGWKHWRDEDLGFSDSPPMVAVASGPNDSWHVVYKAYGDLLYANSINGFSYVETVAPGPNMGDGNAIAVAPDGVVHVLYNSDANSEIYYVQRDVYGVWSLPEIIDSGWAPYTGPSPALAIDKDGNLHASWTNPQQAEAKYAVRNPAGIWSSPEVLGYGLGHNSIAVTDSAVHIAWRAGGMVGYATGNAGAWDTSYIPGSGDPYYGLSLAMGNDNMPRIAAYSGWPGRLNYYERKPDMSWKITTLDSGGDAGKTPRLTIEQNGAAHIMYERSGRQKYATNREGKWQVTTLEDNVGTYGGIHVDQYGRATVFYRLGVGNLKVSSGQFSGVVKAKSTKLTTPFE